MSSSAARPRSPARWRALAALLAITLVAAACSSSDADDATVSDGDAPTEPGPVDAPLDTGVGAGAAREFPPAPEVPTGPLHPDDQAAIDQILGSIDIGFIGFIPALADHGDARNLWALADLLRFTQGTDVGLVIVETAEELTGTTFDPDRPWNDLSNHLLAWDLPAPDSYPTFKAGLYTTIDDRWSFVFSDPDHEIDYRLLSWGGVLIDDRELGDPERCPRGCIPALDDPLLTPAAEGDWYPDEAIVFGVEIAGEAVALPRNIMEVHEMVNMTIGGRRVGIPYCTLCGAAQVFFTDEVTGVDRPPVLRTSGFLSRSNKVMYDLDSRSVFDTFTGRAIAGPLHEAGVVLTQASIVTTTWGDWRTTHPDTQIIAEDGGIGREYDLDPLRGRDDNGPVFPIGQVDDRLPTQEQVLGIDLPEGGFVAFPVAAAQAALRNGDPVEFAGVAVELDGLGLRASVNGEPVASHQAFWFAWSQFHPETELWLPA